MHRYGIEWEVAHKHFKNKWLDGKIAPAKYCSHCPEGKVFQVDWPVTAHVRPEFLNASHDERRRMIADVEEQEATIVKDVMLPHVLAHGYVVCSKCESLVKKTGLSSHKKSYGCQAAYRVGVMHERGMIQVSHFIHDYYSGMSLMADVLKKDIDWEDAETRDIVDDACTAAKRHFATIGGIARVCTHYEHGEGWQECSWAPKDIAFFMEALHTKYQNVPNGHIERNREMWEFLESSDFERECAIGMLDLALDVR